MQVFKQIIALTKPYWPRVALGIVLSLLVSGITGAIAWLVKPALDVIFVEKRYEYLTLLPLGVFVLFTAKGFLQFGQVYLMKSAGLKLVRDAQNRLHAHLLRIPVSYYHKEASGVIISRVINDVRMLGAVFSEVIRTVIVEVPTIIVLLAVALYRKWDLTLLSLVLVPLTVYGAKRFGKRVKQRALTTQIKLSRLTHRLGETVTGTKVIKVFNREHYREEKFIEENKGVYRESIRVVKLKEFTKVLIDIVTGIGIGAILWYGGSQVKSGLITSGDFASIIAAVYLVFTPMKKIGDAYSFLQEIRAALERIDQVVQTPEERSGALPVAQFASELRFNDVSFSYASETTPVLNNITLTITAGEVVAIVGPSGSGKTTLSDLIPRFYDPTEGSLTLDGADLRELDLASLRTLIGIVSQDVILFNDTVRENIAFGCLEAPDDDIRRAAETAYAHEFIEKLPEGYETVIGERGLTLSGGQRQRLAIARAILKNPPLLILDEATSSLDTVSEALVQKALEGLMKGRTTIVIAHRLSTIKNADRIVVLEDGEIRGIGRHAELLATNATYAKLCNSLAAS